MSSSGAPIRAPCPPSWGTTPVFIGEAYVSRKIAIAFVVAAVVIAVFLTLFRFWRGGVALRATATDQAAAYSCGINVPGVFSLAWIVGCGTAAGAGVLLGSIGGISPAMGVFGPVGAGRRHRREGWIRSLEHLSAVWSSA